MLFLSCSTSKFVEFHPVIYNDTTGNFEYEESYSQDFLNNFIGILEYFHYEYEVKNGKLYISKDLYKDKEFLWNLCNKAETSEWLDSRKNI